MFCYRFEVNGVVKFYRFKNDPSVFELNKLLIDLLFEEISFSYNEINADEYDKNIFVDIDN